ncbi:MAG: YceI family protein [Chitinophagaceae bacterium]|nr:YceI family protein [Chitinophagaceae bacterium]
MPEVNIIIKGVFEGSIPGIFSAGNNTYSLSINGHLTLHGVTRLLKTPGVKTVKDQLIKASSSFTIRLSDFKIKIPTLVANNISKEILIKVIIPSFTEMN